MSQAGVLTTEERQEIARQQEKRQQEEKRAQVLNAPVETQNIFSIENIYDNILFWVLMFKLGQKDPKSVERILTTLFKAFGDGIDAYCRSGVGNRISAWGSGVLLSLFMERFGLLTHGQTTGFHLGLNVITGAEIAEEFTTLLPWKALSPDIDFPTTVVLGDKSRAFKVTREAK